MEGFWTQEESNKLDLTKKQQRFFEYFNEQINSTEDPALSSLKWLSEDTRKRLIIDIFSPLHQEELKKTLDIREE